jgi:ElaB/YqjD/DUF883 family membrane-anchored ribosome-binding protein
MPCVDEKTLTLKEVPMPSNSQTTTDDLTAQVAQIRTDMAELTKLMTQFGKAKTHEATDAMRAKAADLRHSGEEYAHAAGEKADEALEMVRRQPATAIAVAVGVGFIVGLMSRRS